MTEKVGNKLDVGDKVLIKTNISDYQFDSGKVKAITKILPNFGKSRAFELDEESGIWCIVDFVKKIK